VTSANLLAQRLPKGAIHQFVPVDLPGAIERFLDHWRPDLALWAESELWPNLIQATASRGVPMALVNARLSERSFAGWRRVPRVAAHLLSTFAACLAQSEADAARLHALGARQVTVAGNLKFAAGPLPSDDASRASLAAAIGTRPCWLAASTHAGEEAIVAAAQRRLMGEIDGLLLLLAPRHPARGPALATELRSQGFAVRRRSAGEMPTADTDVYLADTLGELGTLFRLAPVAVIGGSFAPHGGHNPFEPAVLGSAILFGPHMENFAVIAADLVAAGGAIQLPGGADLAHAARRLLADPAERERRCTNARNVSARYAGVLDTTLTALAPLLADGAVDGTSRA
jgi:3-deoxy-D-manno-octulosonic-acid transferase